MATMDVSTDVVRAVGPVPSTKLAMTSPIHTAPTLDQLVENTTTTSKKKKKKKSKKSAKSTNEPNIKPLAEDEEPGPLVLRISRNKHWRYISSYHVCCPHLTSVPCIIRK